MIEHQAKVVATICEVVPGVLAVYRFGSWDTAQARGDSDIDLAILPIKALQPMATWELAHKLAEIVARDVDLVDLRSATSVMRLQVIAYGVRLYCAEPLTVELFETMVYSSYARLNEERHEILADIRQRGSVYGQ